MSPPKRPWFRFYTEAVTDPKLRRLSLEERWLWVVVLAAARQSPVPGWLMVTESMPMEADDLSDFSGATPAKVEKALRKMVDLGLLVHDGDAYRVAKWSERQFESDDVSKRTAKHRSKNGDTSTKERSKNAEATPSEAETDEDDFASEVFDRITDARAKKAGELKYPSRWKAEVRRNLPAEHGERLADLRAQFVDLTPSHAAAALEGDTHSLAYLTRVDPYEGLPASDDAPASDHLDAEFSSVPSTALEG